MKKVMHTIIGIFILIFTITISTMLLMLTTITNKNNTTESNKTNIDYSLEPYIDEADITASTYSNSKTYKIFKDEASQYILNGILHCQYKIEGPQLDDCIRYDSSTKTNIMDWTDDEYNTFASEHI